MLRHTSAAATAVLVRTVHHHIIAPILVTFSEPVAVANILIHVISARLSTTVLPQCRVNAPTPTSATIRLRINRTATAVPPHPERTRVARITAGADGWDGLAVHVRALGRFDATVPEATVARGDAIAGVVARIVVDVADGDTAATISAAVVIAIHPTP
jgi:hypothetical protein